MFQSILRASLVWPLAIRCIQTPFTAVLVAAGLAAPIATYLPAYSSESSEPLLTAQAPVVEDGIYLYGQSPEPDQIGAAYLVFKAIEGTVVGAFYMPHSSFDCVYGRMEADRLALTIVNSYDRSAYPYAIALDTPDPVATVGDALAPIHLEGFYPIAEITDNDRRIIDICQADQSAPL